MLEDYIVVASAGIMVATAVVLASFLSKYRKLVQETDQSTRLAKDVWDSANSHFSVMDTRIIDLMAKTEVLTSRLETAEASGQPQVTVSPRAAQGPRVPEVSKRPMQTVTSPVGEATDTEKRVLRFLAEGSRDSAQIREEVGKSREHTARLMKLLFDRGFVVRNDKNRPYVYEITETGRSYLAS